MHELAIMESILKVAVDSAQDNNAEKILRIQLTTGIFSGIVPHYAALFFKMISKGTIAEGADLKFETTPALFRCSQCGAETQYEDISDMHFECHRCKSENLELISGREFLIENMEVI
jgi:hydrogenase nickel incorporation protein HypA/HybF